MGENDYCERKRGSWQTMVQIVGAACLFISALFFAQAAQTSFKALSARRWVETRCRILNRGIRLVTYHDKHGSHTEEHAWADYSYIVDGRRYLGGMFDLAEGRTVEDAERRASMQSLEIGTETVCFVSPKDPYDVVMHKEMRPRIVRDMKFYGGGMLLAASLWGVGARSAYRKRQRLSAEFAY